MLVMDDHCCGWLSKKHFLQRPKMRKRWEGISHKECRRREITVSNVQLGHMINR